VDSTTPWRELLLAAQDQSKFAISEIYRRFQPNVLRYLRVCDLEFAEDVASSVWMDAARSLRGFEGDEQAFLSWLFTIVRRRLIDHQRRMARPVVAYEHLPSHPSDASLLAREEAANVAATVRRLLPAIQAEVVLLRTVAGLSTGEVAVVINKSETAVRILQSRGLRKLAELRTPEKFLDEVKQSGAEARSSR
jgi:RNA polymerase sigma-70 factor, ECF subfamily